jgi:hypothetical protein
VISPPEPRAPGDPSPRSAGPGARPPLSADERRLLRDLIDGRRRALVGAQDDRRRRAAKSAQLADLRARRAAKNGRHRLQDAGAEDAAAEWFRRAVEAATGCASGSTICVAPTATTTATTRRRDEMEKRKRSGPTPEQQRQRRVGLKTVATMLPPEEAAAFRGWAHVFDRSQDAELKLAIRLHLHAHMLAHLNREDGRADVRAKGYDPDVELERVKASLAELMREAFGPRSTTARTLDLLKGAAT